MGAKLETREGKVFGPWRKPVNRSGEGRNIHDDGDAQKLGFRGGLVAGSIHMEMFVPPLVEALGEQWLENGNLSLYFKFATLDGEEVRAIVGQPQNGNKDVQVETYGERPDGTLIAQGTASVGNPDATSALKARDLDKYASDDLRILGNYTVGDEFEPVDNSSTLEAHEQRLEVVTEKMPWYTDAGRWGGLVATPAEFVQVLQGASSAHMGKHLAGKPVGLFGAIEMNYVNGPLLVDRIYKTGGSVRALGQSPKTEYMWFDAYADDEDGRRVGELRMMTRFMKASSVLYNEDTAAAP